MSKDDPFGLSEDRERTRIRLVGSPMPRAPVPMHAQRAGETVALASQCAGQRLLAAARIRARNGKRAAAGKSGSAAHAPARRTCPGARCGDSGGLLAGARRPGRLGGRGAARRPRAEHAMGWRQRLAAAAARRHAARRCRCRHAVFRAAGRARAASQPRPRTAGTAVPLHGARFPRQVSRARPLRRSLAQRRPRRRRAFPARRRRRGRAAFAELERRRRFRRTVALHGPHLGDGGRRGGARHRDPCRRFR